MTDRRYFWIISVFVYDGRNGVRATWDPTEDWVAAYQHWEAGLDAGNPMFEVRPSRSGRPTK